MESPTGAPDRATTASTRPVTSPTAAHGCAQALLGAVLTVLELVAVVFVVFRAGMEAWADGGDAAADRSPQVALAVTAAVALVCAALFLWSRQRVAAAVQGATALLLLFFLALGSASDAHGARDTGPGETGRQGTTYGQCRSGGDNAECAHSGG